jgi:hypothetical protein
VSGGDVACRTHKLLLLLLHLLLLLPLQQLPVQDLARLQLPLCRRLPMTPGI